MHPYLLIPLSTCAISAALAGVIWMRGSPSRSSRLTALLVAGAGFWSFCEVLAQSSQSAEAAIFWLRASAPGWIFSGPLILHLCLEVIHTRPEPVRSLLAALYAVSGALLLLAWTTPAVVAGAESTYWGWSYSLGPAFVFFHAYTMAVAGTALVLGVRYLARSHAEANRRQARWLALGIGIPTALTQLHDLLLPLFDIALPKIGPSALAFLGLFVAWSLFRYGYSPLAPGAVAAGILERLPTGVALLDPEGRIVMANAGLARLFGCTPSACRGDLVSDRLAPGLDLENAGDVECELVAEDESRVPVAISHSQLSDKQGHAIGHVLVVRDQREVVALRKRLLTSGRLAAVGQLAAGIAHEINNPLTYARANLSLLRRHWDAVEANAEKALDAGASADENFRAAVGEGAELIDESLEGVDRAVGIVRDIRSYSHAGRGEREYADLRPLLDACLRMVRPQFPEGLHVEKDYAVLPPVLCAPQDLRQVFLNLVMNACQAAGPGGSVRVATEACDRDVVIRVEDDGPGVSEDVRERIFDPFFTTKPVGQGTGLGLAISYEIVRRHGGDIGVESEPGRTSFSVRLPIEAELDADA